MCRRASRHCANVTTTDWRQSESERCMPNLDLRRAVLQGRSTAALRWRYATGKAKGYGDRPDAE